MEITHTKIATCPLPDAEELFEEYRQARLGSRDQDTVEAYQRTLRKFAAWMKNLAGHDNQFHPEYITRQLIEIFLDTLPSSSYKNQAKSALSGFCTWLAEDKQVLTLNPTRGIAIPTQGFFIPRVLEESQRVALHHLVDREKDLRGKAAFALGFWAGCRVSDVSHMQVKHTHLTIKAGWITVGHQDKKVREIDLVDEAYRPLYEYLYSKERKENSAYVFTSQRSDRWSEDGIQHWWQQLKKKALRDEAEIIDDITFYDLRHDFAHRAREAGWSLEEVSHYLGHITKRGTLTIRVTVHHTHVSREQVKSKLKDIKG